MKTSKLILAALPALLFSGCTKESTPVPDLGLGYFPDKVGTWVEYQVDSLYRDDLVNILDSVSYRMLERIVEWYDDPTGRKSQRIIRYVRNAEGDWVERDVWSANRDVRTAERVEENKRRIKLSFPIREGRTWDMNATNTDDRLDVALRDVDKPWQGTAGSFDSTAVVRNTVGPNLVRKRNFEERFAKGVGMVRKYWEETNTTITYSSGGQPTYKVQGWRLNMHAVAYGVN